MSDRITQLRDALNRIAHEEPDEPAEIAEAAIVRDNSAAEAERQGKPVLIEVIGGPEGPCLAVGIAGDCLTRVAGPKPWGGGTVLHRFTVDLDSLTRAVGGQA